MQNKEAVLEIWKVTTCGTNERREKTLGEGEFGLELVT